MSEETLPNSRSAGRKVVLFDGVCHLCDGFVEFVLRRDRRQRFYFAALQSDVAVDLLRKHDETIDVAETSTVVLCDGPRVFVRSDAVVRVVARLGFPWTLLWLALLVPRTIRDALYRWVARNRYRWFGRREFCRLPTAAERERFL